MENKLVKEFAEFLAEKGLLEQVLYYSKEYPINVGRVYPADYLFTLFEFKATPEGKEYWTSVALDWCSR